MTTMMRASAREMRHMVGRYLHARGCPAYTVNAVRDAIMAAQAVGFDAVTVMEAEREKFADAQTAFAVEVVGDTTVLDGRDSPAIVLAPAAMDEIVLSLDAGRSRIEVRGTPGVTVLSALGDYAAVRGVAFDIVESSSEGAVLQARSVPPTPVFPAAGAAGPAMERILREGYELDAEQFWRLFHESNGALTPDSEISRRHAGSQLYDEDGNLLGEVSEETYLHLRSEASASGEAVLA